MSAPNPTTVAGAYQSPLSTLSKVWIGVAVASWAVALALTVTPPLSDPATLGWLAVAVVVIAAMVFALSERLRNWPAATVYAGVAVAIGGWAALMFHDDRWSVLSFALFSMCFTKGREAGIALAAIVSGVWLIAEIAADSPSWTLLSPFTAFAVGTVISIVIYRVGDDNEKQAVLISQLQDTREELAASERERATLAERARFAGEVHDTLAQGFTSIVLLSRATQRNEDWLSGLASIESTAEENLAAARRLVAAMRPVELDRSSLADALQRQVDALGDEIDATLTVEGTPTDLGNETEVALLRAVQEALLNVRTHSAASTVHVTLSYVGSSVLLDVVDDGIGLARDSVRDRGTLTGGQGLASLRQRAETLGGTLEIEAGHDGGTAVSVRLPRRQL
ncbi:MAG: sensor histidine kinase [Actinomycetota bacterium]